jgi:hypothetical protein
MRYTRAITLLSLVTVLVASSLAEARTPRPYVQSVTPLNVSVGELMTIKGFYFTPGYAENVVVFVAKDGRVSYVRSEHSTKKSMQVRVPKKLERILSVGATGRRVATRFRIKVIARRASRVARGALSQPLVGPDVGGDCDKDGTPNPDDVDDDADMLPDSIELKARTNPCNPDSDGDKLLDGWEYMSGLDLNHNALPYPGKRPFPNALFADADIDYDGDGLYAYAEHAMWWAGGHKYPLDYSDGDQSTKPESPASAPWNDRVRPFGELSDDERDFDRDGLSNIAEFRLVQFSEWTGYPGVIRPSYMDPDTDGDGVLDGHDDQDHDDLSNLQEWMDHTWAMNPCDPLGYDSRTCPKYMMPGEEPEKPDALCLSPTLLISGVPHYDFDPLKVTAEQIKDFCKIPEGFTLPTE